DFHTSSEFATVRSLLYGEGMDIESADVLAWIEDESTGHEFSFFRLQNGGYWALELSSPYPFLAEGGRGPQRVLRWEKVEDVARLAADLRQGEFSIIELIEARLDES
ncbi:MAG: hypothetical protein AAFU79_36695, partial [Myxococcota bacterium]